MKKWRELKPGDVLGDYHNVGPKQSLAEVIQSRITDETIAVHDAITINGDVSSFLALIVSDSLGRMPVASDRLTNKLITVLQPDRWGCGWLIGWTWDGQWSGLANLRLAN